MDGADEEFLEDFVVTFGAQYAYKEHPTWEMAHPDGWVLVRTKDEDTARHLAFHYFKSAWSFIYALQEFVDSDAFKLYPRGKIATLDDSGLHYLNHDYEWIHKRMDEDEHHDAYQAAIDDAQDDPHPPETPDELTALFNATISEMRADTQTKLERLQEVITVAQKREGEQVEAMIQSSRDKLALSDNDIALTMRMGLIEFFLKTEPMIADALIYGVEPLPHGFVDYVRINYPQPF